MIISYCNKSLNSLKLNPYIYIYNESEVREYPDFLESTRILREAVFYGQADPLVVHGKWIALQDV